jgi:hypothetical protein
MIPKYSNANGIFSYIDEAQGEQVRDSGNATTSGGATATNYAVTTTGTATATNTATPTATAAPLTVADLAAPQPTIEVIVKNDNAPDYIIPRPTGGFGGGFGGGGGGGAMEEEVVEAPKKKNKLVLYGLLAAGLYLGYKVVKK